MLNTHNSLIIREQQNKIEAPADSRKRPPFKGGCFVLIVKILFSAQKCPIWNHYFIFTNYFIIFAKFIPHPDGGK